MMRADSTLMHHERHSQQRIARLLVSVLMLWTLLTGSLANAQSAVVAPREAMDAYRTVDDWVRSWDIEQSPSELTASTPFAVVAVTIRADGRVLGRSALCSLAPDEQILWRATRQAMHRAGLDFPSERDAGWEDDRATMIRSMTLTVELAGAMIPIAESELGLPGFGRTPGSVGIALRSTDAIEAMTIDTMLMQGLDPTQAALSLGVSLSGDGAVALGSIDELVASGYTPYWFQQTTLTQPKAGFGAEFVDRGSRVIGATEISTQELRRFASGIASHLRVQRWPGIERYGLMGTLDPVTGKHTPEIASAFEQSLAAMSLLRYGSLDETEQHLQARKSGRGILRDLGVVEPGEMRPDGDFAAAAMCAAAFAEIDSSVISSTPELADLYDRMIVALPRAYSTQSGFDQSIDPSARGLVAWGMIRASSMDSRIDRELAQSALRAVFREVPAAQLVGQMPFLGWAELEAAGDEAIPAGAALAEMRQLVWDHMLRPADLDRIDRDLAGGIVFTSSQRPLPSWHSLRPLAFIATMLGDERLTEGTVRSGRVPREIGELVRSLRFVRQLAGTGPIVGMYPREDIARWGIRASLWDQRMPIESSAMGLLMASETLRSLEEIGSRSTAESKPIESE